MRLFDDSCDSFVKIKADDLIDKANQSLAQIKINKAYSIKEEIKSERTKILKDRDKKRASFWSKIFGYKELPIPTDEQIVKHLDSYESWCSELYWIEFRYMKYESVAYRLLNAAKHAEYVYVSTTDLRMLL